MAIITALVSATLVIGISTLRSIEILVSCSSTSASIRSSRSLDHNFFDTLFAISRRQFLRYPLRDPSRRISSNGIRASGTTKSRVSVSREVPCSLNSRTMSSLSSSRGTLLFVVNVCSPSVKLPTRFPPFSLPSSRSVHKHRKGDGEFQPGWLREGQRRRLQLYWNEGLPTSTLALHWGACTLKPRSLAIQR